MSNIYIQEPPTSGKVLLKTTVGDIDIELWSRECPKACRNFVQLCMEGYYNGTTFHRIVKGFIVQGGDPNGDGTGGESIYGTPFKDEFHSRLRYTRRGLVGMANSDKDDNGSQFFFTLAATPELQNKNTLFGKVAGDTVYNMLKLDECEVDHNEKPFYQHRVISAEILSNPFDDIVPREKQKTVKKDKSKRREKGVKNFGLLSFGEEAEGDEQEAMQYVQKNASKTKSMHDIVDDPKLSKEAVRIRKPHNSIDEEALPDDLPVIIKEEDDNEENRKQRIQEKLKTKPKTNEKPKHNKIIKIENSDSDDDVLMTQEEERARLASQKKEEIRKEITALKKEYQADKRIKEELMENKSKREESKSQNKKSAGGNELIQKFLDEKEMYSSLKTKVPKKGTDRQQFTLELLSKFRSKLGAVKEKITDDGDVYNKHNDEVDVEKDILGDDWMSHSLEFQQEVPILAKDASTKSDDWYDVYDPRNPLNKRKRGEAVTKISTESRKKTRSK